MKDSSKLTSNLHKTLKLFETEFSMEYCEEFDEIKAILEYFDQHVRKLSKLYFRGGNTAFINDLVGRFQNVFVERGLIKLEDGICLIPSALPKLRKIAMFLFFNSDATYKFNLRDDPDIGHVLEICPLMPKCLLMSLIWDLGFESILFEIISYMPSWFIFVHLEQAIDTIKYEDDAFRILEKVHGVGQSILINMARSERKHSDIIEKKIIYGNLYDHLMNLLSKFNTPDASKLENFKKLQKQKYSGFVMKHLLELVLLQFDLINDIALAEPKEYLEIYDLFNIFTKPLKHPPKNSSKELATEMNKCLVALLNALQNHVFSILLDDFITWAEFDLDEDTTLQEKNGLMAFEVYQRIKNNKAFIHDVGDQLQNFMIRPKTVEEKIKEATLGDKLRALDKDLPLEEKRKWLTSLLQESSCFGNDECLEAIRSQSSIMEPEHVKIIMDYIKLKKDHVVFLQQGKGKGNEEDSNIPEQVKEEIDYENENIEELNEIILSSIETFEEDHLLQIIEYHMKSFPSDFDAFQSLDFENKANGFFNKFVDNFNAKEFYLICFEKPCQMFKKFLDMASTNKPATIPYIDIMKATKSFTFSFGNQLLVEDCKDPDKLCEPHFPVFVAKIYERLYFPDDCQIILKQCLCDNILKFRAVGLFELLYPLIKTFSLIDGLEIENVKINFGDKTAPVLLVIAEVLDSSRWDMKNFSESRCRVVEECISVIKNINSKFYPVASKKDRLWLTKSFTKFSPTTRFYFQRYSLEITEPSIEYTKFLKIDEAEGPLVFLVHHFARSTAEEAKTLIRNATLKSCLTEAMMMYGDFVERTKSQATLSNYRHCLTNYFEVMKTILLPEREGDSKKIEKLLVKFLGILAAAPKDIYEECFLYSESILNTLLEKLDKPLNEATVSNIRKHVTPMTDCKTKEIFLAKFENLQKDS